MVYVFKLYNLPYTRTGFGEPVQNLFKFADGEKVISMLSLDPAELAISDQLSAASSSKDSNRQTRLSFTDAKKRGLEGMIIGSSGYGFRFPLSNLMETTRSGRKLMTLKGDDKIVSMSILNGTELTNIETRDQYLKIPVQKRMVIKSML